MKKLLVLTLLTSLAAHAEEAAQSKKDKAEAAMLVAANAARTFPANENFLEATNVYLRSKMKYEAGVKTDNYGEASDELNYLIDEYNKLEDFL